MRARGLAILLFALALPSLAAAADKRVAAQHFRSGSALYDQGRYLEALEEFDAGFAAFPSPGFHVNMGQCHRKLDRLDDAALEFTKFLDAGAGDPQLRDEVAEALSEIKVELGKRAEAAEAQRRQRDDEQRRALTASLDSARATPPPSAPADLESPVAAPARLAVPAAALRATPPSVAVQKKSRWWVWTLVGVAAVGALATGVAVGVVESQPAAPRAGSLGLLDGRR